MPALATVSAKLASFAPRTAPFLNAASSEVSVFIPLDSEKGFIILASNSEELGDPIYLLSFFINNYLN
jgi:hypothetical protein